MRHHPPMQATAVRRLRLAGETECAGELWEERLVRPLDLYPQRRGLTFAG